MAIGLSTAAANALLDSGINTTFNSGTLEIRDGTRPGDADTAPTGSVLCAITLPADCFNTAASGAITKLGTWQQASAAGTGTATWFRVKQSGDAGTTNTIDERIDGDVGTSGSDLNLSTTTINNGDQVTINTFTLSGT